MNPQVIEQLAQDVSWLYVLSQYPDGEAMLAAGEWSQAPGAWDSLKKSAWALAG